MQKFMTWLEPASAVAGLLAAAAGGLPYLADYGHHEYACWGQLLPCIINTKADIPAGVPGIWLSLGLLAGFTTVAFLHALQLRRLFHYALLVIGAAYLVAFIVVEGGFFVAAYQISAVCVMVACLAAITRQIGVRRLRIKRAGLAVSSLVVLWLFSGVGAFALAPRDLFWPLIPSEPPDAQDSLRFAVPTGWDASGTFIGFDRFTADELNRIHQGSKLRPLRFVTAGTPSTRLDIVSVNPIDRCTWGAVALSSSGRCDAILTVGCHPGNRDWKDVVGSLVSARPGPKERRPGRFGSRASPGCRKATRQLRATAGS
ncbi:MAG: hypothetical protein E6I84_01035 [Chloroflexi bacterium]|nr:MAG: hypothetical protein E6I84_01035 [Chloroflexota bacterium]